MKQIKSHFLIFLFFLPSSCQEAKDGFEFKKVFFYQQQPKVDYHEFFQRVEFLELKFDNEVNWIGNIDQYQIAGDHVYLMDESQRKKIVKFDLQGNFVAEANSVNDGPEGFSSPYMFSVDVVRDEMLVLDRTFLKLVKFDLNFNYKSSEKLNKYYSNIAQLKNGEGLLLFPDDLMKESGRYVVAYKRIGNNLEPLLHTRSPIIPFSMEPIFFNKHSRFFHLMLEEKVYRFDDDSGGFVPVFEIVFEGNEIPSKMLSSTDVFELNQFIQESGKKCCTFNGVEDENHYFFLYHQGIENHGIAKVNKSDFNDNVSATWTALFRNSNIPVPFGSGGGFYYSIGYLSKDDYEVVSDVLGLNTALVEFPDFREKLFLFKFFLK